MTLNSGVKARFWEKVWEKASILEEGSFWWLLPRRENWESFCETAKEETENKTRAEGLSFWKAINLRERIENREIERASKEIWEQKEKWRAGEGELSKRETKKKGNQKLERVREIFRKEKEIKKEQVLFNNRRLKSSPKPIDWSLKSRLLHCWKLLQQNFWVSFQQSPWLPWNASPSFDYASILR